MTADKDLTLVEFVRGWPDALGGKPFRNPEDFAEVGFVKPRIMNLSQNHISAARLQQPLFSEGRHSRGVNPKKFFDSEGMRRCPDIMS